MVHGALTALITPMRGGKVDYDQLTRNVEFQIEQGIDGLVPVGTTGESPTLTHDEHDKVIEAVIAAANKRVPIVAGTGSNSTAEALRLTQHAKEAGADLSLQVNPYYNKPSQEGLYRHFMTIADEVGLPIVLYNIPGRTGITMSPQTVARLAKHPKIVAIKEATGSLDIASEIAATCDLTILSGDDSLTLPLMSIGAKGVISVATNLIPAPVTKMVHLAMDGKFADARAMHLKLFELFAGFFIEGNPVTIKAAMQLCGKDTGEVRLPLAPISDENGNKLRTLLSKHGLL